MSILLFTISSTSDYFSSVPLSYDVYCLEDSSVDLWENGNLKCRQCVSVIDTDWTFHLKGCVEGQTTLGAQLFDE